MNINTLLTNFQSHITDKVKTTYLYPNDEYGVSVNLLHYDTVRKFTDKELNKNGINVLLSEHESGDKTSKCVRITQSNFGKYFDKSYSWNSLVADLLNLRKECIAAQVEANADMSVASLEYATLRDTNYTFRTKDIQLFKNSVFSGKYNSADDELLFDHLFKDYCNNIYLEIDNKLYQVPFKANGSYEIANVKESDMQIWPAFFAHNDVKFKKWIDTIMSCVEEYSAEEDGAIEDAIIALNVPRLFLNMCTLSVVQKGVNVKTEHGTKTEWYYVSTNVHLCKNGRAVPWTMSNKIDVFSTELLKAVDFSRIKVIPIFSNDANTVAVKHLPRYYAVERTEEPKLSEYWARFLGGDRFFNPIMDKFKLACFVNNALNANYSGRQVLVLGGEGEDGKGVFLDILSDIIGEEFVASLNVNAFMPEDRFSLSAIQNKKVIYLSDCKKVSTLFASDKFKALTGGDKLTLERKYVDSMQYRATGICVALASNNSFYINGIHGKSRTVPVVFRKNFDKTTKLDKAVLEQHLIAEKEQFLQWCADYAAWICDTYHGITPEMCCVADADLCNLDSLNADELFMRMCDSELLGTDRFCNYNNRSADEEADRDIFNEVIEEWFKTECEHTEYITVLDVVTLMNQSLQQQDSKLRLVMKGNVIKMSRSNEDYKQLLEYIKTSTLFTYEERKVIDSKKLRRVLVFNRNIFVKQQACCVKSAETLVSSSDLAEAAHVESKVVTMLKDESTKVKNYVFSKLKAMHNDIHKATRAEIQALIDEAKSIQLSAIVSDTDDDFYSHMITPELQQQYKKQYSSNIVI